MAKICALPNGAIWQFFASYAETLLYTVDPVATLIVDFDDTANAALVADIKANQGHYSIVSVAGVPTLKKDAAAVTISAASSLYPLQAAILSGVPDATLKATIAALWNGTATAAQQQKALAYCLLKLHQAGVI